MLAERVGCAPTSGDALEEPGREEQMCNCWHGPYCRSEESGFEKDWEWAVSRETGSNVCETAGERTDRRQGG